MNFLTNFIVDIYQLLPQYHKILAACNIQGERACEFSFNIAQSQYIVVLIQQLFFFSLRNPKKFRTFEPIKFPNAKININSGKIFEATLFSQIALQNLQRKNLGFSETVLSCAKFLCRTAQLFCHKPCCMALRGLFLRIKVKVYLLSVF